jgi:hypothetical protein
MNLQKITHFRTTKIDRSPENNKILVKKVQLHIEILKIIDIHPFQNNQGKSKTKLRIFLVLIKRIWLRFMPKSRIR